MYLHLYDIITVCLGWKYYINILRMQSRINGDFPEGWRQWKILNEIRIVTRA